MARTPSRADRLAWLPAVSRLIDLALDEDLGRGDVTTDAVIGQSAPAQAGPASRRAIVTRITAREPLVIFGLDVAAEVFRRVDDTLVVELAARDGDEVSPGEAVMTIDGPATSILRAERTALNFLGRLSGVATLARRYATAVAGTPARVVDTRKTTPGYRVLEKAAVLAGGAGNHRFDLGSGVLIKDNHIAACGSVTEAVERARKRAPHGLRIEIEVDTSAQLDEALAAGADIVLLDNMTVEQVVDAAERAHRQNTLVEVSGGITLDTVRSYAEAGADLISVGALTHSARSVDLGLDFIGLEAQDSAVAPDAANGAKNDATNDGPAGG